MGEELKPCPFCGGEAILWEADYHINDHAGTCTKCGVSRWVVFEDLSPENEKLTSEEVAAKVWNTRADGWHPISSVPFTGEVLDLWHENSGREPDVSLLEVFRDKYDLTGFTHWRYAPQPPRQEGDVRHDQTTELRRARGALFNLQNELRHERAENALLRADRAKLQDQIATLSGGDQ